MLQNQDLHIYNIYNFSCVANNIFVKKHCCGKILKRNGSPYDIVALRIRRKLFVVLKISCFPACTCRGEKGNSWQTKENQARPLSGKLCFQEWLIHKDEAVFSEHHSLFWLFCTFLFKASC